VVQQETRDPVWARETGRRRATLTRDAIVRAAIALADAEGIDAVSIRRVATELGARTMSIYTYIDRKEDLLDLMVDEVAGGVIVPGALPADWREATLAIAGRERATVRQHPWMIELVGRRTAAGTVGPNALRHLEQTLEALTGLDAPPEWRWRLVTAVGDYTTGFVIREATLPKAPEATVPGAAASDPEAERVTAVFEQPYLRRQLASGEFPNLAGMLDGGPPPVEDNNFEQGLRWILDGLEAQLRPQ
jgi:AcrR family transcriptional regulator